MEAEQKAAVLEHVFGEGFTTFIRVNYFYVYIDDIDKWKKTKH